MDVIWTIHCWPSLTQPSYIYQDIYIYIYSQKKMIITLDEIYFKGIKVTAGFRFLKCPMSLYIYIYIYIYVCIYISIYLRIYLLL